MGMGMLLTAEKQTGSLIHASEVEKETLTKKKEEEEEEETRNTVDLPQLNIVSVVDVWALLTFFVDTVKK